MMKMFSTIRMMAVVGFVVMFAGSARAASPQVSHELDTEYSYAGGATTLDGDRRIGSVDENYSRIRYVCSPPLTKNLLLRVGAEWERYDFGLPAGAALPNVLQQISAVIGCDYQLGDQWLVRGEIQPGVYGDFRDIRWREVDVPFVIGAVYLQNPDLQWMFGLRVDARNEYPVLPAIGVRWKINNEWTLNLMPPAPRVEYSVTDNLQLYFGANMKFFTGVVNPHFGSDRGLPQLNNAALDYTEIRVGPGVIWKLLPNLTLEAEGGWMLGRSWTFHESNIQLTSRQAPYAQIAVRSRF